MKSVREVQVGQVDGVFDLDRAVDHPAPPPPLPPFLRGAKKPKWYDKNQREAEIHLMVVKTLVMSGADLDLKDQRGRTALEIARMYHQTRISEFLESR